MVPGLFATTPLLSTWLANNSEPYYRRATSIAAGFIAANSVLLFSFFFFASFLINDSFSLRVLSLALGVSPRRKVQGIQKQRLWIWYCKWPAHDPFINLRWSYPIKPSTLCIIFGSLLNVAYLSRQNKSKTRIGRREELLKGYNEDKDGGLRAWMELGDKHPDFRYTL